MKKRTNACNVDFSGVENGGNLGAHRDGGEWRGGECISRKQNKRRNGGRIDSNADGINESGSTTNGLATAFIDIVDVITVSARW